MLLSFLCLDSDSGHGDHTLGELSALIGQMFLIKNYLNLSMVSACIAFTVTLVVIGTGIVGKISIVVLAVVGCLIGFHVVGSVGGGRYARMCDSFEFLFRMGYRC